MNTGDASARKVNLNPASKKNMAGQFEVICRVRPHAEPDTAEDILIDEEKSAITMIDNHKNLKKEYTFHKIINQSVSQSKFTSDLVDQLFKAADSYQVSLVLGYGVTNSGKTYTILGDEEHPGLLYVLLDRIFRQFPDEEVSLTAIQIYGDEFYSLKDKSRLYSKQNYGGYQFDDYSPSLVQPQTLSSLIKSFIQNRNQTDTKANRKSSRSHAIFKIQCQSIAVAIADLAGSERLNKIDTNIQETKSINSSLHVLGRCVHAFRDGGVVPFRQSKLTKMLSQFFWNNCKIFMVAHINRSGQMFHENVNVLQYASVSAKAQEINPFMNRSIFKSARKRQEKSKSCLKNKCEVKQESIDLSAGVSNKRKKITKTNSDIEIAKVLEQDIRKLKKEMMDRYIFYMYGRMEEADRYLNEKFEDLDRRDRIFIEEMRNTNWQTPQKTKEVQKSVKKAQDMIKIRQQILKQIEKERLEKQQSIACQTEKEGLGHDTQSDKSNNEQEKHQNSFIDKIVASANKLTKVGNAVSGIVDSAVKLIQSYSQKKKSNKKKPHLMTSQQISCQFDHHIEKLDRGCGSFSIDYLPNDPGLAEQLEKLVEKVQMMSQQSDDSQLLDVFYQLENEKNHNETHTFVNNDELPEIRQSEQFGNKNQSPFFKQITQEQPTFEIQHNHVPKNKGKSTISSNSTTSFNKDEESTTLSSLNEDVSSDSGSNLGKGGKNKHKKKDFRHPMEFRIARDISPVRTRSQRNNKLQFAKPKIC